jgi:hypothetical protein
VNNSLFGAEFSAEGDLSVDRPLILFIVGIESFLIHYFAFAMAKKPAKKASTLLSAPIPFENLALTSCLTVWTLGRCGVFRES